MVINIKFSNSKLDVTSKKLFSESIKLMSKYKTQDKDEGVILEITIQ